MPHVALYLHDSSPTRLTNAGLKCVLCHVQVLTYPLGTWATSWIFMSHKGFLPSAELWHAAIYLTGAWLLVGGSGSGGGATDGLWFVGFPALSWGFPLLPHIIKGGVWYHRSILETLAADESGAYYFCESLPHMCDADALYCLSFPVGTAEFELTCVFSREQKGCWERRNKNQ